MNHPYAIIHTKTADEIAALGPNQPDTEHELYVASQMMIKSLNITPEKSQIVLIDFRIMNPDAHGIMWDEDLGKEKESSDVTGDESATSKRSI